MVHVSYPATDARDARDARLIIDVRPGGGEQLAVPIVGYSLSVGEGAPSDPCHWVLEGKADKDSPWVLLDRREHQQFLERWRSREFHVRDSPATLLLICLF